MMRPVWVMLMWCAWALRRAWADILATVWVMSRRKAAGDLEMQLHEAESRWRLEMAKMRMAGAEEAETVAGKVEAMGGQVTRLQSVEAALERGVLGLLESRRHLEGQMARGSAPKQDLERAGEEIARLQANIEGLGKRLRAREDEMGKLREAMQVAAGCVEGAMERRGVCGE